MKALNRLAPACIVVTLALSGIGPAAQASMVEAGRKHHAMLDKKPFTRGREERLEHWHDHHEKHHDESDIIEIDDVLTTSPDGNVVFQNVAIFDHGIAFTHDFEIESEGIYQVTLTDFEFPRPLTKLGLNLTSATESFGQLMTPGSFIFDADPGNYFISFFGKARHLGQYGIEVSMVTTSVPVPGAAWLFGSGLIGLAGVIRRRSFG